MQHHGSVLAPNDELALQYARDFFSRRNEALRLWVVPREAIQQVDDADWLKPPFDRTYRVPAGYNIVEKIRAAKARTAAQAAEVSP
jgi:ring-1,2-phenylacetyl-CoA epoxidase subunit PaaB